jgi:hypothetical protein
VKNKGKGLGRGIDALFQDIEEVDVKKEEVLDLPLNELRPNPYQPRKTFDEQSLKELANSIERSGVFQPIIVHRLKDMKSLPENVALELQNLRAKRIFPQLSVTLTKR